MKTVEETKVVLNKLILEDKKHIKFFEDKFEQFDILKKAGANMYFVIEGNYYIIKQHKEVGFGIEQSFKNSEKLIAEKPTFETYFIRLINAFANYEDNNCTSWILENIDYLKNRVQAIYEKNKTCHIYQFKRVKKPTNNDNNRYIEL